MRSADTKPHYFLILAQAGLQVKAINAKEYTRILARNLFPIYSSITVKGNEFCYRLQYRVTFDADKNRNVTFASSSYYDNTSFDAFNAGAYAN